METKHTEGIWLKDMIHSKGKVAWIKITDEHGNTIAEVKGGHCGIPNRKMNANAKLMITSPDLLTGLRFIQDEMKGAGLDSEGRIVLRITIEDAKLIDSAIKKATS